MSSDFSSIPVLDLSLADDPRTKPQFLSDLRHAIIDVGFLYLKNFGLSLEFLDRVCEVGKAFFELPMDEKLRIEMKNGPHFLGYSRLGNEITARKVDFREQVDIGTELPTPSKEDPRYRWLYGPNMWPKEELLPGYRSIIEEYIEKMGDVAAKFLSLVAEAIDLPPTSFDQFFEPKGGRWEQQHKLKIVRYPDVADLPAGATTQGVGPHKDSMLSSYLLQATEHRGLQAQNCNGEWIDCPPFRGTVVVALGQGMESITQGICTSTTHRVISPPAGQGARFSIPFFQGVGLDAQFEAMRVPDEVRARLMRGKKSSDVEFTFTKDAGYRCLGEAILMNRVKSHPDVGERWYPDLLAQIRAREEAMDKLANGHHNANGVNGSTKEEVPGTVDITA